MKNDRNKTIKIALRMTTGVERAKRREPKIFEHLVGETMQSAGLILQTNTQLPQIIRERFVQQADATLEQNETVWLMVSSLSRQRDYVILQIYYFGPEIEIGDWNDVADWLHGDPIDIDQFDASWQGEAFVIKPAFPHRIAGTPRPRKLGHRQIVNSHRTHLFEKPNWATRVKLRFRRKSASIVVPIMLLVLQEIAVAIAFVFKEITRTKSDKKFASIQQLYIISTNTLKKLQLAQACAPPYMSFRAANYTFSINDATAMQSCLQAAIAEITAADDRRIIKDRQRTHLLHVFIALEKILTIDQINRETRKDGRRVSVPLNKGALLHSNLLRLARRNNELMRIRPRKSKIDLSYSKEKSRKSAMTPDKKSKCSNDIIIRDACSKKKPPLDVMVRLTDIDKSSRAQ